MKTLPTRLLVTIDTECDKSADWRTASPLTFRGATEGIANRLQPLFQEFGIRPTYLISPEVMCDTDSVAALAEAKDVELTTHLHGDYIVPGIKTWDFAGTITDEMQWEYGPDLEARKMAALTEMFKQQFGHDPKSFRAGRFGISHESGKILRDLGYVIDSSVTPHITWTSRKGEKFPDFTGFPEHPYQVAFSGDIWQPGQSNFLELPVTILPPGTVQSNKPNEPIWFRPWYSDTDTLVRVMDHVAAQPAQEGVRRPLVMMFHNVEIIAGASPYPQSELEVIQYLDQLKRVFEHAVELGISSCTMNEYHDQHSALDEEPATSSAPVEIRTKPLRRELSIAAEHVFDALEKNDAPAWFKYVFEDRANRWDVWQPCFWLAENMPATSRVLSVGCGAGYNLFWLAEHGFNQLTGIDVDRHVIGAANTIAKENNLSATFTVDDGIRPQSLGRQQFDVIEALNWTMLVDGFNVAAFLDEYLARLSDDGVLIFDAIDEAYNQVSGNEFLTSDMNKPESERRPSEYKTRISETDLRDLLEARGHALVQVFSQPQRVPRNVFIIGRHAVAGEFDNSSSPTTEVAPAMFNQSAAEEVVVKRKIHLIADVPDWIFARHCTIIASALSDEFDFDMGLQGHGYDEDEYDLIYPLEWNLVTADQIKNPAKYITGIRSHTSWQDHKFDVFTNYLREKFGVVHVVSERLFELFSPGLNDVRHLTHGVDTQFFKPRQPVNSNDRKLRIGWAGNRVNPTKGFEQLIKPLGELPDVELVYCGYMDRKLELPEMREFYESIDAYICSSEQEGNNNSLMEAAAMERAIITTDNGTVPEYLTHDVSALIVDRAPEAFVQAVEQLRDNPELRTRLGESARESVVEKFEWRQMIERHRALFREAIEQSAAVDPLGQAETNVRQVLEHEPQNLESLRLMLQILVHRENWPEASQIGERILQQAPDDIETIFVMAKCFFQAGDIEAARVSLEHVLELDADNELARQNLADLASAESALAPEIEEAIGKGLAAIEEDRLPDALAHYQRALELGLENAEIEQLVNRLKAALHPREAPPGWSFCVITNGKKPEKLKATLESIRATNFANKEILVGGEPPADLGGDITIVPVVDGARNGRLGEMRNRLTERAQYDHLVVCDDDMLFHSDFAAGLEAYGDDWEVLCVRLLNPDGSRFWDWATHGGPKGHCLLDYGETDSHTYVTGGLCIMKADVARRVQWDDGRGFYQGEDLDFSGRLHQAGVSIKFNRNSTVTHDDARYTQSGNVMIRRETEADSVAAGDPKLPIRWLGPVFNPSGYASEGIDFLLPLADRLDIGLRHQSTLYSDKFVDGLAPDIRTTLFELRDKFPSLHGGITISHNPANGFDRPADADYCIGRTMFETDRISPGWVSACNRMDEVWVPSAFNVETFANSGVERDKLVVMPGAVDSNFFDPDQHEPLPLPNRAGFNFLAIFEWSSRKAWDVLLAGYLREFSAEDDVCLYLRTYQFGKPDGDPAAALWREIREFAETLDLGGRPWPRIELLTAQVASHDLPRLYKAADCLVGISRGEGWGRPHHEAMSMALPVIATNWSGNTEFMTEDTACLIDCVLNEARGLEPELWHYKGHNWADPSETQLRESMRRLQSDVEEANALGQRARAHVVQNFNREAVAKKVIARLSEIERELKTPSLGRSSRREEAQFTPPDKQGLPTSTATLQVAWEGSYLDFGSLSLVNREITKELAAQEGIKLTRVGKNALPKNADNGLREMARHLKPRARNNTQVTIRHNWPPDWSESAAGLRIHCQPWEYGVLPADWVEQVDKVDQVWAYTDYVRRVYIDSGVDPAKVKIVPLGIDPDRFTPAAKPMELATRKTFKFLFVGGTIHRKGVDVLLQAFLDAFDIEDDVCLVIKDFGGNNVYAGQTMADQIRSAQTRPNAPEILYLDSELGDEDIPGLYTACDCLVHSYRGEGFGLPVLEAMACGLPAIVTGGGATDDFATDEYAWRIPALRSRLGNDVGGLKLDGNGWMLEPDVDALKHRLCEVAADPIAARSRGEAASEHARNHWTWKRSAEIAAAQIHEAWQAKCAAAEEIAERRSRTGAIDLPAVARVGELSQAAALLLDKKHEDAWQTTLNEMVKRPFHPEAWLTLARIALDAGDVTTAKQCLADAERIAPGYGPARKLSKSLRKKKGSSRICWPEISARLRPGADPRLSVILISKNEEQFLDDCLGSVKDVADQLVVVDTGSSDRTMEIAKRHGADVHEFKWTGDFSAARNESLAHARGDWVLFIDADEELSAEGADELRNAMQQSDALAWRLPIVDVGREHLGRSFVPRLFRNAPGLFFVGRIHEQVSSSVEARREEWGLQNRIGKATLRHKGYQESVVSDRNKVARNVRLLEQAVEEFPNDANLLMNFGLELAKAGQIRAALEQYAEAFEVFRLQPDAARTPELREALVTQYATHLLGQNLNAETTVVLESAIARAVPLTASQEFLLGLARLNLGRYKDAARAFKACLKKRGEPTLTPVSSHIVKGGPDHCLALCLAKLKDSRAGEHFEKALEQDAESIPLHIDYARHLAEHGKPVEGIELLHQVIGDAAENLPVWQAGGNIALGQPELLEFATEWTTEAQKYFPSDPIVIRQRAEALMLSGQCAEALPLWEQLLSRGGATTIGAVMICLTVTGRELNCPAAIEHPVSDAFIQWYRRLLECGNETTANELNRALPRFATALPFAAKVLETAIDEAVSA